MAKPEVTCGAKVYLDYDASPQTANLSASATGSPTGFTWTMLWVPPGSVANVGVNGDFTDGVATIVSPAPNTPSFNVDADVDGEYVVRCIATGDPQGDSDPTVDKENGQQPVVVGTSALGLPLPGKYVYDWQTDLNNALRTLEANSAPSATLEAGANIAEGDLVRAYNDGGDPKIEKAQADAEANARVFGVADAAITAGNSGRVLLAGLKKMTFGSSPAAGDMGKPVYLSLVAGEATLTAPSGAGEISIRVGYLQETGSTSCDVAIHIGDPFQQ